MDYKQAEVHLSIVMQGGIASRGKYGYYHNGDKEGLTYEKMPIFTKCKKQIHLGNAFIHGALEEAPEHLNMRTNIWRKIPEKKRIEIHVASYVRATHPEHRGYELEIL